MQKSREQKKFKSILNELATVIPEYRQTIFKTILLALVIGNGKKCISAIYRTFETILLSTSITRKRFYCFLKSGKIPWKLIWKKVFQLLGDRILTYGRLIIALDDTVYGKSGKKIANCDTHFDHAAKINSSKYLHGHCRVVIGILAFVKCRWACLPVAQAVYRLKANVAASEFATKIEIAAALISEILEIAPAPLLIVCDSWFGNNSLMKEMRKKTAQVHILTRLRIDSALYDYPSLEKRNKRGRKPKYGKRLPSITEYAQQLERHEDEFLIYGKKRKCRYSVFTCMHQGFKCEIKIVVVYHRNNIFPIVSTDLTLTPKQMIELFSARWKIESGFKELKHELGALDNQARKEYSVENHFNLCCLAMTSVWIYAMEIEKCPDRLHPKKGSQSFSFADIRRKISKEYKKSEIFDAICPEQVKSAGNYILKFFFERVA